MQVAEPLTAAWRADLHLEFTFRQQKSILSGKRFNGPLVVQKPLYPEGEGVCHAIIVHPPGGIAGGDELFLDVASGPSAHALLTTPGAGKWYRSAGPWARQSLSFDVAGTLEWLPRETIVFDGAQADLRTRVDLRGDARYFGWEVLCLGRTGSGESFRRGSVRLQTEVRRDGRLLWTERGRIHGGGALLDAPAGMAGRTVCGTLVAASSAFSKEIISACKEVAATTVLPGILLARYLGDSSEEAMSVFTRLWMLLRPATTGREASIPRIWST
ncbi:MAG TPA: urease accessory protein UreD [Polyangiaceae bacterium]|nr:urease accessory protein UreD [Polyangiaceae bacterium]